MSIQKITYSDPRLEEIDDEGFLAGDKDTRNVTDNYKRFPMRMIKESLNEKRLPLVNIISNYSNDFNKATIVRSTNAFLGNSIYIIGKKRFDRRGTVGTHHTEIIYHAPEFDEVIELLKRDDYTIFAVDNTEGDGFAPQNIWDTNFPLKSAFVYGEEGRSLDEETIKKCDNSIFIHQRGSVRSLNVAVAASIVMAEYMRQHRSLLT